MSQETVLIVDDDGALRRLLSRYLHRNDYQVCEAASGEEMRSRLAGNDIDLIILDLNLRGESGLDLTHELRRQSQIPIIILSASTAIDDKVSGLELGADDYLTKPFDEAELLARVRSVLRRLSAGNANKADAQRAYFSGWMLDRVAQRLVSPLEQRVQLTSLEYRVLSLLVERANSVITRDEILKQTTNREWTPFDRTVDVVIAKLRKKIELDPKNPQLIKTVRNAGYIFSTTVDLVG